MIQYNDEETDLTLVQRFFAERKLLAKRIPKDTAKTTDFKILHGSDVVAFCEVKSPQDIFVADTEEAIIQAQGRSPAGRGDYGIDTSQYRAMERGAKKSAAQFTSVNPDHSVPNILVIVNHDTLSQETDFVEAVTGYVERLGYIRSQTLRASIPEIDVYIWIDITRPLDILKNPRTLWCQNSFRDTVVKLLRI